MTLTLQRIAKKESYTIGHLYIDGVRFCDTLEDTDRGLSQNSGLPVILRTKVYGKTAIPTGTYNVTLDVKSPKFSRSNAYDFCSGKLPRLKNVPGFEGILIHIGNSPEDTDGCILVGQNKKVGLVLESATTFRALYDKLMTATDNITITIV